MPANDRDPLAATVRLLIDGNNLLHALARTPGAAPPAALIGRLRAVIPAPITIELVFDGPAEPGLRHERIASGLTVRYSGARTADALILALVDDVRKAGDAADTAALLVVTNDRDLRHGAQMRGARTASSRWLLGRLEAGRPQGASIGNPRSPRPVAASAGRSGGHRGGSRPSGRAAADDPGDAGGADGTGDADDRPGWKPGRGATTKRGNPRKAPRTGRAGRMRP